MKSVTVDKLEFAHGKGFRLGPVDIDVPAGQRAALVGPSGSGKTTLLRLLAGLETPAAGTVAFDGDVVSSPERTAPAGERRIGYVFQQSALWPHMTAVQHVRFAAPTLSRDDAVALLDRVGLGGRAKRRPAQLSGGEGQRLALARAIAGNPDVLLLDEPLRSVDVHLRDELGVLIRQVARERSLTLILVTHDRDEALALADRIVVLTEGRVVDDGYAQDLLTEPSSAFTASFLCRATCMSAGDEPDGHVQTVFGRFKRPGDSVGTVLLTVLPGDVELDESGDGPEAIVARIEPTALGPEATVELGGQSLSLACNGSTRAGDRVHLRLAREPRLLPIGGAR